MLCPNVEVAFTCCGRQAISSRISRIVGKDAAPRGVIGLRTYVVGHEDVVVIDPDPPSRPLLDAILDAAKGRRISHVALTHSHGRRSPLAVELNARSGARIVSASSGLADGRSICGRGFSLEALATPGHCDDHFAFALEQENALFCGDLVCGWSASVVIPPGGDAGDQLASLQRVRSRGFSMLLPAHGPPVIEPDPFLADCLRHCGGRERQILTSIADKGPCTAWQLAESLCLKDRGQIQPAGAHAILAHLVRLSRLGLLVSDGAPALSSRFALALADLAA